MELAAGGARERRGEVGAHLALSAVQLFFALFPVFGKLAFAGGVYTPLAVGSARILFGALSLGVLALALHGSRALPPRRELPRIFGLAILGVAANMTLYLEGLKRSTAGNATLMICLIPVFTFTIAVLLGHETFGRRRVVGLLLALCGAAVLVFGGQAELGGEHTLGNVLIALNCLGYAAYLVLVRPLAQRHPPLAVISWMFVASLPWLPLMLWRDHVTRGAAEFSLRAVLLPEAASTRALLAIGFIVIFPTTLAYLFNVYALSRVRASTTAVYIYSQPLGTAVAAWLVLDERVTPLMGVSAALLFPGIWLVSRPAAKRKE
ncbi:MAG: DMT family transporter [Planctomycetes bacterium]|nr:DMT family transporter [Planctomycetota bacterium]